jgi:hypothetical protein
VSAARVTFWKLGARDNIQHLTRYRAASATRVNNVENYAPAQFWFANGAVLAVDASYSLHIRNSTGVKIQGDKGGAEIEPELPMITEQHDTLVHIQRQIDSQGEIRPAAGREDLVEDVRPAEFGNAGHRVCGVGGSVELHGVRVDRLVLRVKGEAQPGVLQRRALDICGRERVVHRAGLHRRRRRAGLRQSGDQLQGQRRSGESCWVGCAVISSTAARCAAAGSCGRPRSRMLRTRCWRTARDSSASDRTRAWSVGHGSGAWLAGTARPQ